MKKNLTAILFVMILIILPCAAASSAVDLVKDIPTVQAFKADAVPAKDVQSILQAGVNAPSAINSQPWHFSVVTDKKILQQISDGMKGGMPSGAMPPAGAGAPTGSSGSRPAGAPPAGAGVPASGATAKAGLADAPLAIIISAKEGKEFDAGLACQNMSVEAQLLGYGTKIISSPTIALNGARKDEFKALLGIPEDQSAVAVLLIGKASQSETEIVSSATARNPFDNVVTYVK